MASMYTLRCTSCEDAWMLHGTAQAYAMVPEAHGRSAARGDCEAFSAVA